MSENTNKKNCAHRWAQHIKQGIFRTSGSDEFRRIHTNAIYGFLTIMFKILDEEKAGLSDGRI